MCKSKMNNNGHNKTTNCAIWNKFNKSIFSKNAQTCRLVHIYTVSSQKHLTKQAKFFQNNYKTHIFAKNPILTSYLEFLPDAETDNSNRNIRSQPNSASSHFSRSSLQDLDTLFPGTSIGRKESFQWPPRSPDITIPDYLLWGYLKNMYNTKLVNIGELTEYINVGYFHHSYEKSSK